MTNLSRGERVRTQAAILERTDRDTLVEVFRKFIRQRPGLDRENYMDNTTELRADYRITARDKHLALAELDDFAIVPYSPLKLAYCLCFEFSGRLSIAWDDTTNRPVIEYNAGQNWPTEYRGAVVSVLENYSPFAGDTDRDVCPVCGYQYRHREINRLAHCQPTFTDTLQVIAQAGTGSPSITSPEARQIFNDIFNPDRHL